MAVMGSAMARVLFDLDRPTVGLLNIGVEEVKGLEAGARGRPHPARRAAAAHRLCRLRRRRRHRQGQGRRGGDRRLCRQHRAQGRRRHRAPVRRLSASSAISQSIWSKLGYLLARPAFRMLREKMDPRKSNGGVFLGLNGVVIKSHGGTDAGRLRRRDRHGLRHGALRAARPRSARPSTATPAATAAARAAERSGLVTVLRSVVLGCGSYLPARVLTNQELAGERRHLRRVDRAAHRHPPAPYRGGRRGDLRPRDPGGAARRSPTPTSMRSRST